MTIVFYVSSHGYGHATRQAALIAELKARRPDARLLVRSQAPAWLLAPGGEASCRAVAIDPGVSQCDGFTVELERTLARHERFLTEWDPRVEREAAFLRKERAALAVSDVAALPFAAAARAGVRAVGIGNFSWDVVLGAYPGPRFRAVARVYAQAYGLAGEFFRLPMHMEAPAFPKVTDCPLLTRRCAVGAQEARRELGLPDDGRPIVLASFGGLGRGPMDLSDGDDLSAFVFAGFGPAPRGLGAQWVSLPDRKPGVHLKAMAACDVAAVKPGYGVLSEALAHGRPVLLLPRSDFAETAPLSEGFLALGRGLALGCDDFGAGRWKAGLLAALALPAKPAVPCDGAAFLADRLLTC